MFCAQIKLGNTLRTLSRRLFAPSGPFKYCKNVIGAQNMLIYFRLHYLYICQGVDASKANLSKKALTPCILKNYLIYFENKLSYSECIVRVAQKWRITRE